MIYLFLDLAKTPIPAHKIPYNNPAQIGLLVTRKQAKKLIAPEEPHDVYILPEKKAAHSIICAIREILAHHPDANISIISPRKKIQAAFIDLQNEFPQAQLSCERKLSKGLNKAIRKLKNKKNKKKSSEKREKINTPQQPTCACESASIQEPQPHNSILFYVCSDEDDIIQNAVDNVMSSINYITEQKES